jgi:hypothetical protein
MARLRTPLKELRAFPGEPAGLPPAGSPGKEGSLRFLIGKGKIEKGEKRGEFGTDSGGWGAFQPPIFFPSII